MADPSRISPTAHYTSYVWFRNGLSHPALTSRLGAFLHRSLRPMNLAYEHFGDRPSLDMMLLARHHVIDHLLERALAAGEIGAVVEIAAGFSARGLRFTRRHPSLVYIEGDLPGVIGHKREALARAGGAGPNHQVVELNALVDEGPTSLAQVLARHTPPEAGVAVLTEGLVGYFDTPTVTALYRRIARALALRPRGLYLSDLNLGSDLGGMRSARAFRVLLSAFARGKVYAHFPGGPSQAIDALEASGFREVRLHLPGDFPELDVPGRDRRHVVRIVEARP
jgi:O-methyltransferase involved in polyketide biosynthesis